MLSSQLPLQSSPLSLQLGISKHIPASISLSRPRLDTAIAVRTTGGSAYNPQSPAGLPSFPHALASLDHRQSSSLTQSPFDVGIPHRSHPRLASQSPIDATADNLLGASTRSSSTAAATYSPATGSSRWRAGEYRSAPLASPATATTATAFRERGTNNNNDNTGSLSSACPDAFRDPDATSTAIVSPITNLGVSPPHTYTTQPPSQIRSTSQKGNKPSKLAPSEIGLRYPPHHQHQPLLTNTATSPSSYSPRSSSPPLGECNMNNPPGSYNNPSSPSSSYGDHHHHAPRSPLDSRRTSATTSLVGVGPPSAVSSAGSGTAINPISAAAIPGSPSLSTVQTQQHQQYHIPSSSHFDDCPPSTSDQAFDPASPVYRRMAQPSILNPGTYGHHPHHHEPTHHHDNHMYQSSSSPTAQTAFSPLSSAGRSDPFYRGSAGAAALGRPDPFARPDPSSFSRPYSAFSRQDTSFSRQDTSFPRQDTSFGRPDPFSRQDTSFSRQDSIFDDLPRPRIDTSSVWARDTDIAASSVYHSPIGMQPQSGLEDLPSAATDYASLGATSPAPSYRGDERSPIDAPGDMGRGGRPYDTRGSYDSPTTRPFDSPANRGFDGSGTRPFDVPGAGNSGGGGKAYDANSKTYSFVALPGNTVKKRPRRRYDEIERLYQCNWNGCTKAYGTLNHLNAHVTMQKHGPKRSPNEFKELRKLWRKAKKDAEALANRNRRPPPPSAPSHMPASTHIPAHLPSHLPSTAAHLSSHLSGLPSHMNSGDADAYGQRRGFDVASPYDRGDTVSAYDHRGLGGLPPTTSHFMDASFSNVISEVSPGRLGDISRIGDVGGGRLGELDRFNDAGRYSESAVRNFPFDARQQRNFSSGSGGLGGASWNTSPSAGSNAARQIHPSLLSASLPSPLGSGNPHLSLRPATFDSTESPFMRSLNSSSSSGMQPSNLSSSLHSSPVSALRPQSVHMQQQQTTVLPSIDDLGSAESVREYTTSSDVREFAASDARFGASGGAGANRESGGFDNSDPGASAERSRHGSTPRDF